MLLDHGLEARIDVLLVGEDEKAAMCGADGAVLGRSQLEHARTARLRALAEEPLGHIRVEHG